MVKDERGKLINEICMYLTPIVPDLNDAKSALYMILDSYEITGRSTELAEVQTDRNDHLVRLFLIAKSVKGCSNRTIQFYGTEVRKILQRINKTVDDITADDIRLYMAIRSRSNGVSNVTIGNEIRAFSSFLTWLTNEEYITRNPMLKVDSIKQVKSKKKAFTEIEIEQLRMVTKDERESAILEVLLSTGCRVSELVGIAISDIEGERVLVHGKGAKDRYVYLNAKAQLAVKAYLNKRSDSNPYLFPKGLGILEAPEEEKKLLLGKKSEWWKYPQLIVAGTISTSTIEQTTRRIAKRAGVEKANPHKFRRTCATMALRRGMPIEQVSKMLGHESIETTQIYLDLSEEDLKLAHKRYVI
ncbi:MAG: tyrosine-type recombinase/integrase [Eubacteriales bacterium]|nr:tyrosine-type recombinase/integrase [Eubacteriales bacterium]